MCNSCQQNSCGCSPKPTFSLCNPLCPPEPCTCPVEITTDCITLAEDLECSGVSAGIIFTEAIQQLDEYICTAIAELSASINLVNVGTGAEIYKGVDGIGRKQIKTITSDGSVTITENENDIELSVPTGSLQGLQSVLNTGNNATFGNTSYILSQTDFSGSRQDNQGSGVIERQNLSLYGNETLLSGYKTLNNNSNSISSSISIAGGEMTIAQTTTGDFNKVTSIKFQTPITNLVTLLFPAKSNNGTEIIATLSDIPTIDGSETKIANGTNTTVTGNGTTATPYIINSTATGASTVINAGTNISVSGAGTSGSPFVISNTQVIDGSETKLNSGTTTVVTGNGTTATPYTVETVNLQKAITTDYTLLAADNNYSIKINNAATPITITVPSGLPSNFFAGFTQKGTADVTFAGSGTTITNPIGLKIKGQGYAVGLEQIGTSNSFDLLADTKA